MLELVERERETVVKIRQNLFTWVKIHEHKVREKRA